MARQRPSRIEYPTPVDLALLDIPTDKGPGFYVVARNIDPSRAWRGAALYQSPRRNSGYRLFRHIEEQAVAGVVRWIPNARRYRQGQLDRESRIMVTVPEVFQPLETVGAEAFAAGRNTFLVGPEIVQVRTWDFEGATGLGERMYAGSEIRRALWGTGISCRSHRSPEPLVWLDSGGIEFVETTSPMLEGGRWWKAVPAGGLVGDAEPVEVSEVPRFSRAGRAWNWAASWSPSALHAPVAG